MAKNGTVYLIHFDEKLCHAQHYIGFTTNITNRMKCHRNNSGAKLLRAINQLGLKWQVVRTWENETISFEYELKATKNAANLCPICSGEAAYNRKKGNQK